MEPLKSDNNKRVSMSTLNVYLEVVFRKIFALFGNVDPLVYVRNHLEKDISYEQKIYV